MRSSLEAILLILSWEQLRLAPYRNDGAGRWTIGWGHLIGPSDRMNAISREQANAIFLADVQLAESAVLRELGSSGAGLTAHQIGACTSLVFNIGAENWRKECSIPRLVRAGDLAAVPGVFREWNKVSTKMGLTVSAGLVLRRTAEVALWLR